jgi:hypothetical protein
VGRATDRAYFAGSLVRLGRVVSEQGDDGQALVLFRDGLTVMRNSGVAGRILGDCLDWLAAVLARSGDPLPAARLLGAAEAHCQAIGISRFPLDEVAHERDVLAVRTLIDDDAFVDARNEGRRMGTPEALQFSELVNSIFLAVVEKLDGISDSHCVVTSAGYMQWHVCPRTR